MTSNDNPTFPWAILDHLAHPVFVKDLDLRYVFLNRAALALVDMTLPSLVGKTDAEVFPKEWAHSFHASDRAVLDGGLEVTFDDSIVDARGVARVLATTKVPLRNATGKITHLVGVIRDITPLKAAEKALQVANEELERRVAERTSELAAAHRQLLRKERLAVLGRLVAGLAHEIRNPLGAILNASALLEHAGVTRTGADDAKAIQIIREEGWRANRIITDLLDYARIRPAEPRELKLDALVNQVLLAEEIPDAITVERELPEDLVALADAEQTEGALRNVVRNAIEAMPNGGVLTLGARRASNGVLLWVSDTGPGVPAEVRGNLFEPLVTTKSVGLGLGLSTARALVENQGGTLILAAAAGGARFELRLPVSAG